jgi:hypothetical protein
MVHPAAVSDTLVRWAAGKSGEASASDPTAVALLLRAACALWRASPNDEVRARQMQQVHALAAALRGLSNLDKVGTREHWGPADPAESPGHGQWSAECTWSASNKLFDAKPKAHGGTAAVTATAGHALLDAYEVLATTGDLAGSAGVRAAAESAAEWIVEDCGHERTTAGPVFRWAPGTHHRVNRASAAAAGFLARAALALSRDAWLKLAVSAIPALQQSESNWKDASAFPRAAEDSAVDSADHAAVCESLAVIHRASGSAGAEHLLRCGGAYLRMELCKPQPGTSATRLLTGVDAKSGGATQSKPTEGARAHAAAIAAFMNIFKQIEDADGDEALVLAKSLAEWMTSPDSGMRATDDSGVFLSEAGAALPMAEQAACAYAFGLLLEAPEHKQAAAGLASAGSSGGGGSGGSGSSLSDLLMSILEPGVSTTTHIVMQGSLLIMFVVLGAMIMVHGPNIHLVVMFSLGVGLVLSYMWFMAALSELDEDEGGEQKQEEGDGDAPEAAADGAQLKGSKKAPAAKKPQQQRSKKAD